VKPARKLLFLAGEEAEECPIADSVVVSATEGGEMSEFNIAGWQPFSVALLDL